MSPETLTLSLGAVTAAIWAGLTVGRLRVWHVALAYLLAAVCFGPPFLRIGESLSLDRLVLGVLVVLYAWRRADGRITPLGSGRADYIGVALLGWLLVSVAGAGFAPMGKYDAPLGRLCNGYAFPLMMYWIVRNVFDPERDSVPLLRLMVVFGTYLAVTGVMECAGVWPLVFPTYVRDLKLGIHAGRARGPFLQAHSMGMWLTFSLLAVHALWPRLRLPGRVVAAGAGVLMMAGIALTQTRSAWLGAAAAVVVLIVVTYRGWLRLAAFAGLGLAAGVLLLVAGGSIVNPMRHGSSQHAASSVLGREALADISWRMAADKPITGHGFGHFLHSSRDYYNVAEPAVPLFWASGLVQHSTFLSLLTETGVVGLGLFIALLAAWTVCAVRVCRHPASDTGERRLACLFLGATASLVVQMTAVEMAYTAFDHCSIALLAGCVAATHAGLQARTAPAFGVSQGVRRGDNTGAAEHVG